MKIYIAGKVTGMEYKAKRLFEKTETKLLEQGIFTEVVNPMKLPHEHDKKWQSYMKECLAALIGCDVIFMQLGWEHSRGAILEHYMAGQLGIDRYYEVDPKKNDGVWIEGEWKIEPPSPKGVTGSKCPECLQIKTAHELKMFGGLCEMCMEGQL